MRDNGDAKLGLHMYLTYARCRLKAAVHGFISSTGRQEIDGDALLDKSQAVQQGAGGILRGVARG